MDGGTTTHRAGFEPIVAIGDRHAELLALLDEFETRLEAKDAARLLAEAGPVFADAGPLTCRWDD